MADLTVLSLGAGVQSSTLLALAAENALPDGYGKVDAAIFADTHAEPEPVYRWLDEVLQPMADRAGIDIHRVDAGDLGGDMIARDDRWKVTAPLYVENAGLLNRSCTRAYKIEPIRAKIRELLGVKSGVGSQVDVLLGITTDESERIKDSGMQWVKNRFPLIDLDWSRDDCIEFMVEEGHGEPPRSACVFCPYRSNADWRKMQESDYASLLRAIDFDESVRRNIIDVPVYVHRSRRPLSSIDFRVDDGGSLMGNECSGFCGV